MRLFLTDRSGWITLDVVITTSMVNPGVVDLPEWNRYSNWCEISAREGVVKTERWVVSVGEVRLTGRVTVVRLQPGFVYVCIIVVYVSVCGESRAGNRRAESRVNTCHRREQEMEKMEKMEKRTSRDSFYYSKRRTVEEKEGRIVHRSPANSSLPVRCPVSLV